MYKVFFNDRVIFIGTDFKNSRSNNCLVFQVSSHAEAENAWHSFLNDRNNGDMYLSVLELEHGVDMFSKLFSPIEAAGGVVINGRDELLCIKRWGKWDLPKGKAEKNETPEVTAIREVEEECGITGLTNRGINAMTYHIYEHPRKAGVWVLKKTWWFNMLYAGNEELVPQIKEDIVDAQWFSRDKLSQVMRNTWTSLFPVFENFINSD